MRALPRPPLVLIADSHDDSREMLAVLLRMVGYEIAECDGGDGAIDQVQRLSPDVVLLSTASRGDAIRLVGALRDGVTRRPHVILITGHGDPEYHSRALAAGCEACLLKPVDVERLVGALSRLTDGAMPASVSPNRPPSADASRYVQECCSSIDAARAALDRARTVSARAEQQVERANAFLARVARSRSPLKHA